MIAQRQVGPLDDLNRCEGIGKMILASSASRALFQGMAKNCAIFV